MRRDESRIDCFVLGHPPPGTLLIYRLIGGRRAVLVDIRDNWFSGSGRLTRAARRLARYELKFADRIAALSNDVSEWTGLEEARITLAPIGVVERNPPTAASPGDLETTTSLRCVFVGTLNDNFDVESWIREWPVGVGAVLDIYGRGPNEPLISSLAQHHPDVKLVGWVPADEVPQMLERYDVGIAPTTGEFGTNISNKVAEYLASGLYVLHTLNPEPAGVIERLGLGTCVNDSSVHTAVTHLAEMRADLASSRASRRATALAELGSSLVAMTVLESLITIESHRSESTES